MARSMRPVAATALAAWAVVSVAVGLAVVVARPSIWHGDVGGQVLVSAFVLADALVVVTLVARLPRHPVTLVLAAGLLLTLVGHAPARLLSLAVGHTDTALDNVGWLGGLPVLPLLFAVFPDGARGRWRWVAYADAVALALLVPVSFGPGSVVPVAAVCGAVLLVSGVAGAVRLVARAVRRRDERPGTTPFAAVAAAVVVTFVLGGAAGLELSGLTFGFVVYGPSVAIGYGVLRHHLFGLDVVVRRAAIAVTTSLLAFAAYLAAAYGIAALFGVDRSALVVAVGPAIVAAIALVPAYRWVLRAADRRLYGDRRDPWQVMRRLGRDLVAASPDDVPALVAARIRAGLALPWVGLELDREASLVRVAESGSPTDAAVETVELRHAGNRVGRLLVQPRRGQPGLDHRDLRALKQVAVDVSPAVSAARLVDELTESRERLVSGREAERSRLRRELHDGLSPSLAGMSLALRAARGRLGAVPEDADRLLGNVEAESSRAWQAVRRLLSDLRPPGLDELGLVGALEDSARRLERPDDFVVDLVVSPLPALPAAVEVAAYRIATEAMTNAARHSAGHHCRVSLVADGPLDIVVTDDGVGGADVPGIGLRSMAERAADLGGWVHVADAAGHGTVVHARLPLAVAP